jgi:hypothetical protein
MASSFRFTFRRNDLLWLKMKAIRSGIWLKVLSRLDRELLDLTIKVAHEVRSLRLVKELLAVAKKVEDALENRISQAIHEIGFPLARKLGLLAKKWGNPFAESWIWDKSFARFLAITQLNNNRACWLEVHD